MYTNKEIIAEINHELENEIKQSKNFAKENFTTEAIKKNDVINNIWKWLANKLLGSLKIKVTIYWKDKEIFSYVIPKD